MKNLSMLLIVFLFTISITSNVYASDDKEFLQTMEKTVNKLDTASSVLTFKSVKNQFERISSKYKDEWLPVYYAAYCDLESIYRGNNSQGNMLLLNDAKDRLDALSANKSVDQSELNTLWGYYYNALIMADPQSNGQKYFSYVISFYKKAIQQDAENPRPVFLLAFFEMHLPAFLQKDKDYCDQFRKANRLFQQSDQQNIHPHWGEKFLSGLLAKCTEN